MRNLAILILLVFLGLSLIACNIDLISYGQAAGTLVVDSNSGGDYGTIQSAINAAKDGDTIYVKNGLYPQRITITKSINLIGESSDETIIDGRTSIIGSMVIITANNVNVSGLMVAWFSQYAIDIQSNDTSISDCNIGALAPKTWLNGGGLIESVGIGIEPSTHNNTISANNMTNIAVGIAMFNSTKNSLTRNNFFMGENGGIGIAMQGSTSNTISENIVEAPYNCTFGLAADLCYANYYTGNIITGNYIEPFEFSSSNGSLLVGNTFAANNTYIVDFANSYNNTFYGNNIFNSNPTSRGYLFNQNTIWHIGYPGGGNYWSDYDGIDVYNGPDQDTPGSDGIGDTGYYISGQVGSSLNDRYPLMAPTVNVQIPPIPYQTTPPFPTPEPTVTPPPPSPTKLPSTTPIPTPRPTTESTASPTETPHPTTNPTMITPNQALSPESVTIIAIIVALSSVGILAIAVKTHLRKG